MTGNLVLAAYVTCPSLLPNASDAHSCTHTHMHIHKHNGCLHFYFNKEIDNILLAITRSWNSTYYTTKLLVRRRKGHTLFESISEYVTSSTQFEVNNLCILLGMCHVRSNRQAACRHLEHIMCTSWMPRSS